jgi:hypothetical protein
VSYPIIHLAHDEPTQLEQLGTKAKFWFVDSDNQRMLFKEGRPGTGENWAEKVSCEICHLLDIPHAIYDLAEWKNRKGVLTKSFVPSGGRLVFGNELLSRYIKDYDEGRRFQARQHTVRVVMTLLGTGAVKMPMEWVPPNILVDSACVFTGYLMLDALIGNQDRHHENWGLIWMPNEGVYFAPTFDHASSLGRNELDEVRIEMLNTRDRGRNVESYASRAKSALFSSPAHTKPLMTLDAFHEAAKVRPNAADHWKEKLASIEPHQFRGILDMIPDTEISAPARDFAYRMLTINTQRILNLGDYRSTS